MTPAHVCPFCQPDADRVFHRGQRVFALWDKFPVSPGHALVVPYRHVATWFDANPAEHAEIMATLEIVRAEIERRYAVDGFNLGVNMGAAAGQTVPHLHVHMIPRRTGDVPDPQGGVRYVIPERANYLAAAEAAAGGAAAQAPGDDNVPQLPQVPSDPYLANGAELPLLPLLEVDLASASAADIAVAFVMASGVDKLLPHFEDFLARGGRLRLLTGTYLGITDPDALARLLALQAFHAPRVELRVYDRPDVSFHPKAYVLARAAGTGVAYVGSSNLSASALGAGIEWNYRVAQRREAQGFATVAAAFEALFSHPDTRPIETGWLQRYRVARQTPTVQQPIHPYAAAPVDTVVERQAAPQPHAVQREALAALEATRAASERAGLVVLATGLGKTWLAAFDAARPEFARVLFVAHREEILQQALATFVRIRPQSSAGLYTGAERLPQADMVFASVQTLGRQVHLDRFDPRAFDYVVVDEFHHAAAPTYRRLIEHFEPKFLLGLTATPNRTDGGDLLALCHDNLVYECGMPEGISRGLLSPFRYFGVPDDIDYANIPWRSRRFDEEALTREAATEARAVNVLEQWHAWAGERTIGFCVSMRHADFMRSFFQRHGVECAAVHSGPTSDARALSLEALAVGRLKVVFAVDIFNEGVDVPAIDTVMMLRPTESQIVWLQQFGRGLRWQEGKRLTVVDYIGNHRTFLLKARTLLEVWQAGDRALVAALERVQAGTASLPPGCEVTYELRAIELMKSLLRPGRPDSVEVLAAYYEDFFDRNGVRPTASEAWRDGYNPRAAHRAHGSWLGFVASMEGLDAAGTAAFASAREFLAMLDVTRMAHGYEMIVLLALIETGTLTRPGLALTELTAAVRQLGVRDPRVAVDFGAFWASDRSLAQVLKDQPIAAWTGPAAAEGDTRFTFEHGVFHLRHLLPAGAEGAFTELVREIAEWRLAEYFHRRGVEAHGPALRFVLKVKQSSGRPMMFLPDRRTAPGLPQGTTPVMVNDQPHEADFVKVALNVVRETGSTRNVIARLLRGWFGPDAGAPGTDHSVSLSRWDAGWVLEPIATGSMTSPEIGRSYAREQIPAFYDTTFSEALWNKGFVPVPSTGTPRVLVLLVTLDKAGMHEQFAYREGFIDATTFRWQSQNQTTQDSERGQQIRGHAELGIRVELYVRAEKKTDGAAAPFVYCGPVSFVDWSGEKPITITWRLTSSLNAVHAAAFGLVR